MLATMLKNKVMYRRFIHSVAFVNIKCCTRLRPLYLYFPDTPRMTAYIVTARKLKHYMLLHLCLPQQFITELIPLVL